MGLSVKVSRKELAVLRVPPSEHETVVRIKLGRTDLARLAIINIEAPREVKIGREANAEPRAVGGGGA